MYTFQRSLVLMALAAALAPRLAAADTPAPPAGPNASEPGSVGSGAPTTATPAPSAAPTVDTAAPAPAASREVSAPSTKPASRHLKLGADYSLFMPTDGHTRDRFGGSWSSVGLGIGGVEERGSHSLWSPEFNVIYQSKGDNRVLLVPLGVSFRTYSDTSGSAKPYVGASAGTLIVNLQSKQDNVSSGTSAGSYGSIFAGASFTDNFFVEARYYAASKVRSFDLSGLSLSTGVRF